MKLLYTKLSVKSLSEHHDDKTQKNYKYNLNRDSEGFNKFNLKTFEDLFRTIMVQFHIHTLLFVSHISLNVRSPTLDENNVNVNFYLLKVPRDATVAVSTPHHDTRAGCTLTGDWFHVGLVL